MLKKTSSYSLCVLKFSCQICDIVKNNLQSIFNFSSKRKKCGDTDFNIDIVPIPENKQNSLLISLILFSDGVSIKKSTTKKEVWPIWIQVADLPPKLRMARKNIVLASLFVGTHYPNWNELVPLLQDQLNASLSLTLNETTSVRLSFKVRLLVSDLGAKSHMLNMLKFNGYYGCHFCTAEGTTLGRTQAYYPFSQPGDVRDPDLNDLYVDYAETLGVDEVVNVVGVKGKSAFTSLIDGLPLTAPIDYMHCVLLGVFPDVLKLCYKNLSSEEKIKVGVVLNGLACPREIIAYSRKIHPLEEIPQFKANEYFNWLFYIGLIIFLNRVSSKLMNHFTNLSVGIRLLIESSTPSSIKTAEKMLSQFCQEIVSIHEGNERIETINVHSIKHLAEQVKRFGPLFCYSAMCFEAANRTIGDVFTGSHSECEIICRRILRRHNLVENEVPDDDLAQLFCKLTGRREETKEQFDTEFLQTEALQIGKIQYPEGRFFNRQNVNNVFYDSTSYKRSKHGNCFVSFNQNNNEVFGQIQYFVQMSTGPSSQQVYANIRIYSIVEKIGPADFIFRVSPTKRRALISNESLKKVFHMSDFSRETPMLLNVEYIVKLCSSFEHS